MGLPGNFPHNCAAHEYQGEDLRTEGQKKLSQPQETGELEQLNVTEPLGLLNVTVLQPEKRHKRRQSKSLAVA